MKPRKRNTQTRSCDRRLRSLTPPTTRVVGSKRFKLPSELGFFTAREPKPPSPAAAGGLLVVLTSPGRPGFLPILDASNRSRPAAATRIRRIQYLTRNRTSRGVSSPRTRRPGLLRFLLARARTRPGSSGSSSETTEMDTLPLSLSIAGGKTVPSSIWEIRDRLREREN